MGMVVSNSKRDRSAVLSNHSSVHAVVLPYKLALVEHGYSYALPMKPEKTAFANEAVKGAQRGTRSGATSPCRTSIEKWASKSNTWAEKERGKKSDDPVEKAEQKINVKEGTETTSLYTHAEGLLVEPHAELKLHACMNLYCYTLNLYFSLSMSMR